MKNILFLFSLTISFLGSTQDAHLSMYDVAPLFLNPALTGVTDANHRVHVQYRTQWRSVNFKPYTSALVSYDMSHKKWGFGAQVMNFRAGLGNFNVLSFLGSAAYTIPITKNRYHNLTFGLQGGIQQKSLEYQLLSFNNQYTLQGGGGFNTTLLSNENFGGQSVIVPIANAGVMYFNATPSKKINPFIGFSAFNLITPTESFFGKENKLPLRTYTNAGLRINFTEFIYFIPRAIWMQQKTATEITLSGEMGYYLKQSELYLLVGGIYRNRDATAITFGARQSNYQLKVAYDFNISTLSRVSSGRGGFEIAFTYLFKKTVPVEQKQCPRL